MIDDIEIIKEIMFLVIKYLVLTTLLFIEMIKEIMFLVIKYLVLTKYVTLTLSKRKVLFKEFYKELDRHFHRDFRMWIVITYIKIHHFKLF